MHYIDEINKFGRTRGRAKNEGVEETEGGHHAAVAAYDEKQTYATNLVTIGGSFILTYLTKKNKNALENGAGRSNKHTTKYLFIYLIMMKIL